MLVGLAEGEAWGQETSPAHASVVAPKVKQCLC